MLFFTPAATAHARGRRPRVSYAMPFLYRRLSPLPATLHAAAAVGLPLEPRAFYALYVGGQKHDAYAVNGRTSRTIVVFAHALAASVRPRLATKHVP